MSKEGSCSFDSYLQHRFAIIKKGEFVRISYFDYDKSEPGSAWSYQREMMRTYVNQVY